MPLKPSRVTEFFSCVHDMLHRILLKIVKKDLLLAIFITFILVGIGLGLGYENTRIVPPTHVYSNLYHGEPNNALKYMSNWDGPIYINISEHGYGQISLTNFFPLYPILINLFNRVISSPLYSALLVSWFSLVGAIYYYLKLTKHYFKINSNTEAIRAVLLFVLFPSAVFLLATFTESLFAFLSLAAIYYAMKNRFILAGTFSLFAAATRPTGVFLLVLIGLLLLENKLNIKKIFISLSIGSLGLLSYMGYLYVRYSNPFEFIATENGNHGWFKHFLLNQSNALSLMNVIFLLPIVFAAFYWWDRKRSFSIYSALFILIPILGGQFGGFVRYSLTAFPVFFMLYNYLRYKPVLYSVVVAFVSVGWAYFLLQYTAGYIGG
jgi:hypothetical protein